MMVLHVVKHVVNSCVRTFTKTFGEEREDGNPIDPYSVAIKRGSKARKVIGHIPQQIYLPRDCFSYQRSGAVTCRITDSHHQYS